MGGLGRGVREGKRVWGGRRTEQRAAFSASGVRPSRRRGACGGRSSSESPSESMCDPLSLTGLSQLGHSSHSLSTGILRGEGERKRERESEGRGWGRVCVSSSEALRARAGCEASFLDGGGVADLQVSHTFHPEGRYWGHTLASSSSSQLAFPLAPPLPDLSHSSLSSRPRRVATAAASSASEMRRAFRTSSCVTLPHLSSGA